VSAGDGAAPARIGYLAQKYPQLTLTFVYREVQALRAAGLEIQTFSTWRPGRDEVSAEAQPLRDETFYLFPMDWLAFALSHASYLLRRPRRYLGALWFCLSRPQRSARNRLRTFLHFLQGVRLARELERRGLQHVHVHFALNAATLALVAARLTGISFSFTAHANDIFVNPILLPEKVRAARFIVVISEFNRRFLSSLVPDPAVAAKLRLVRYGVDVGRFSPAARRPQTDPPLILAVARLVEKKGFPYLIQACQRLAGLGRAFECVIIGGGPQEPLLRGLIQSGNLTGRVTLAGRVYQEHLREYFNRAAVFVLPCIQAGDGDMDGIPNTLIEAMAMEVPVISTTVSGIPELVEDGRTGLLVPPRDPDALADALARLLDDAGLRQRLGMAGRERVVAEYESGKNAAELLRIFEHYLGQRPAVDRPAPRAQTASRPAG
jgi:glycosyltransferase involved in cell wall biosynthesis